MAFDVITKSTQKAIIGSSSPFSEDYQRALNFFWNNEAEETIEFVTNRIENNPSDENVFVFYRLWIEQLSKLQEIGALNKIKNHLIVRSYENPEHIITWQALRGLVHFELDELQAVDLFSRVLSKNMNNPYCLELLQKINFRKSIENEFEVSLLNCTTQIQDYFHWQSIAQSLICQDRQTDILKISYHISKIYPDSPLFEEFGYQQHVEALEFGQANSVSRSLNTRFPANLDYQFWSGYSSFRGEDYKSAIEELTVGVEATNESDPDFLSILAMSYQKIANGNVADPAHGRALEYFRKAEEVFKKENLPATELRSSIEAMISEQKDYMGIDVDVEGMEPSQSWLIKMNPRQYYEMQISSTTDLEVVRRPMGDKAIAGDLVFFAAENPLDPNGRWRVVSIYTVTSGPAWHPMTRFENELELVYKMESHLEVDVRLDGSDSDSDAPNDPFQYSVFCLEGGALDIITEAVQRRNEETAGAEGSLLDETISKFKKTS